jgi:hypothetical protein
MTRKLLYGMFVVFFACSVALADYLPLRSDVLGDRPQVQLLQNNTEMVQFDLKIPGVDLLSGTLDGKRWDRVEIAGGGFDQETGAPEVPHYTRLLIIPAMAGVRAEFQALETTTIPNVDLMPAQGVDPADLNDASGPVKYNAGSYSRDEFYPQQRVIIGAPAIMRGVRVVALSLNPVQYNPATRELRITTKARVTLHFEGMDARNVPLRQIPLSDAWSGSLRSQALNFDETRATSDAPGSYLMICNSGIQSYLTPLIEWKQRKGHQVTLQTFSTTSPTTSSIKAIIQNAYDTWPVPPEFVLLLGDCGVSGTYLLPGYDVGGWPSSDQIDHPYAQLEGNDILADLAIGRMPASTSAEAQTMVNKVLFYEKMPYTTSTDWYRQGVLIAGNSASGISTVQVNRYIKTRMIQHQYTRIDTFWWSMYPGSVAQTLSPAINNGVLFANYRGCYLMEDFDNNDINNLTNGRKLPFVVTITCGTGGFNGESLMEHFASVGTASTPKGAVGAIGTATTGTHTRQNNTIDMGFFAGVFDEGITTPGNALNYGKIELYNTFQAHDAGSVDNFSLWNSVAGDPGLELFTQAIQFMTCTIPDNITLGANSLSLTVTETGVGPLQNARVCLFKSGTDGIQSVGLTDANGQVTLPVNLSAEGNLKVTITKQNFYPVVDSLDVVQAAVAVGYQSYTVDDDAVAPSSGDNDHIINPGETVQIPTVFKNFGNATTATNVSVTAALTNPYVTLSSATQTFPNLAPGATGNSSGSFLLTVSSACPPGYLIPLQVQTTTSQGNWPGLIELPVVSFYLNLLSTVAMGSDTLLSPGETANFNVVLRNDGDKTATALTAKIISLDSYVTVNDSLAGFGTVVHNATVNCNTNPFNLSASNTTPPGHLAKLKLVFSANSATQVDTITIALGSKSVADPTGPDAYGYYCFDQGDLNYSQHPAYSWVECDPAYGGSGVNIGINDPSENQDVSMLVALPFTFSYYGTHTNTLTVCSNGWISCYANISFADFRNYPIPSDLGPYAMIAPFWDDLKTWSGGHVFSKYDVDNHRFIIEWSRMYNLNTTTQQTFEVILYDPAYVTTPTGDGEIVFQYLTINQMYGVSDDVPYSTIGIESPDQDTGLQLAYWNTFTSTVPAMVSNPTNNVVYKFTTAFNYTVSSSSIDVSLTPLSPPIQIPVTGGTFSYNVGATNVTSSPVLFSGWIMQLQPNGQWQGPMLGPLNLTLPGNLTITRQRNQNVPAGALAGVYTYRGYVGTYPTAKWDSSSFTYTTGPIPTEFALHSAYPNPFNPTSRLSFDLPLAVRAKLSIYDVNGRLVATLVDSWLEAGAHAAHFEATNLASGIYLARLQAGSFTQTQKLVLLK